MTAILYIRGVISPESFDSDPGDMGNTLSELQNQFKEYENVSAVTVFIHSPGGNMDEGFAMHDWLRSLGVPITTVAEGSVYSIASALFLAGDKRLMSENAQLMIHNPTPGWMAHGDAAHLEAIAADLRRREDQLIDFYNRKTKKEKDKLREWMNNETFMSANEAIENGFATGVYQQLRAVAQYKRGIFYTSMSNTKVLNQEKEQEAKGILAQIRNLLGGAKNEAVEVEESEQPEVPENTDIDALKAENEALAGQVEALKEQVEELRGVNAKANSTVTSLLTQSEDLKKELRIFADKYEKLLKPVAEHNAPVVSIEEKQALPASPWDEVAINFKKKMKV